ncbi:hypothetical protein TeGR_g1730 [Tetraparma gracilis]|uniref:Myb-like domain-containing protein n=1 Tax=Tetraparma gracilis TaxID=2962635 RepID=A0ABQ6N655_9STRA|nr:hypothetical protein TeGR_g1730 [Tetraparma gracilis]
MPELICTGSALLSYEQSHACIVTVVSLPTPSNPDAPILINMGGSQHSLLNLAERELGKRQEELLKASYKFDKLSQAFVKRLPGEVSDPSTLVFVDVSPRGSVLPDHLRELEDLGHRDIPSAEPAVVVMSDVSTFSLWSTITAPTVVPVVPVVPVTRPPVKKAKAKPKPKAKASCGDSPPSSPSGVKRKGRGTEWTEEEIDALQLGVEKYGKGRWADIMKDPAFNFELRNRTQINCKDKYRNLEKWMANHQLKTQSENAPSEFRSTLSGPIPLPCIDDDDGVSPLEESAAANKRSAPAGEPAAKQPKMARTWSSSRDAEPGSDTTVYRALFVKLYTKHAPGKLKHVDKLLEKYAADLPGAYGAAKAKYKNAAS